MTSSNYYYLIHHGVQGCLDFQLDELHDIQFDEQLQGCLDFLRFDELQGCQFMSIG
jgi:hypothetical protein